MFESALYVRPSHHHKPPSHHHCHAKQKSRSCFRARKDSKKEDKPSVNNTRRTSLWLRIVSWLVLVNALAVLVFTKQQFRSMAGLVSRKLEHQLPPLLQVLRSDTEEIKIREFQQLQQQQHLAQLALDDAHRRQVFQTPATTPSSVLERGFIRPWESCTLQQARERRGTDNAKPIQVVVLGGPGSALPAQDCHTHNDLFQTDGYQGRYSNLLEETLNHALSSSSFQDPNATTVGPRTPSFEIVNMAHAALVPSVQGLVLDHLIDPQTTDLIIWENSLFDFKGTDHHEREMDFWLSRLQAHFVQAQPSRSPPPILLLHLWDELMVANIDNQRRNNALDDTSHDNGVGWNMEPVVDNYREQKGWNIQVLNVGATVTDRTASSSALVDPSNNYQSTCRGSQLIADMIAHTFYQDLAHCNRTVEDGMIMDNSKKLRGRSTAASVSKRIRTGDYRRNTPLPLTELLVRKDVRVASLHHWEPNIGVADSHLKIANLQDAATFLEVAPIKSSVTTAIMETNDEAAIVIQNATRKAHERLSYHLPHCACHEYLNLTIAEPTLEWLGLAYTGGRIDAFINGGERLSLVHDGKAVTGFPLEGVRDWVHVGRLIPTAAPSYNISLCSRKVNRQGESAVWLHQLVGLMLPSSASPTVST